MRQDAHSAWIKVRTVKHIVLRPFLCVAKYCILLHKASERGPAPSLILRGDQGKDGLRGVAEGSIPVREGKDLHTEPSLVPEFSQE